MQDILMKKRKILREKEDHWCQLELEISGRNGFPELSICGAYGSIVSLETARKMAHEYWVSFFQECPDERMRMVEIAKQYMDNDAAANYVLKVDGPLHGLDTLKRNDSRIFLYEGGGQCTEEIEAWFPEAKPYMKWHLNGMNAGCKHQRELGWGHGKLVVLVADQLTEAQKSTLENKERARVEKRRQAQIKAELEKAKEEERWAIQLLTRVFGRAPVLAEVDCVQDILRNRRTFTLDTKYTNRVWDSVNNWLTNTAEMDNPMRPFTYKAYEDSLCAPCPVCGYEYGTAWIHEKLPQDVIDWAHNFGKEE